MDILTPTGFKNINELNVGSIIYGANGSLQTITDITQRDCVHTYEVNTTDGASAVVGEGQLLNVRVVNGNGYFAGFRNFTIDTLLRNGLTRVTPSHLISGRKPTPKYEISVADNIDFPEKAFSIHPYILGVLLGDGSLHGSNYACFSNPDFDSEIAQKVSTLIPDEYYLKKDTSPNCPRYLIALKQKGAKNCGYYRKVKALGLNVLSRDKFIPQEYFLGSREQRLELLRGLMDTDGSARKNRVSFSTRSIHLVYDIQTLIRSLGGICHYSVYDRGERGIDYDVRFRLQDCPFSLKRKAAEWRPPVMKRHLLLSIKETGEMTNIPLVSVSNPDGLFITNNYFIIHT